MKAYGITLSAAMAAMLFATVSSAADIPPVEETGTKVTETVNPDQPKRKLNGDMTLEYKVLPAEVSTFGDMFSEGVVYGRIRTNLFNWSWDDETWDDATGKGQLNHSIMGIGGSVIFKSGVFNNISFTASYYGSMNPSFLRVDENEVGGVKAGKDTFSRYKVLTDGDFGIYAPGENYLEFNNGIVDIIAGRQLFESVFTASNDTKMIPNTFDGVSMSVNITSDTKARVAWFDTQKLRDHEEAHDVITFNDENGDKWNNNDDSAVHKGLSYANFIAAGEDPDHDLIVADVETKAIKDLKFTLSYLQVPGVVQDIVAEAHYTIPLENDWAIRPGFRYFIQSDDGGGAVAGYTNLTGKDATGYDAGVATSLDSSLFAARIDLLMPDKKGMLRVGYSKVEDKADIVAPWRGFPTGGYTRAMAQYNWYANTETIMVQASYKITPNFKADLRYAIQDFDDNKPNVEADSDVIHLDLIYDVTKQLQIKGRFGIVSSDPGTTGKADTSYNEERFEINYLF